MKHFQTIMPSGLRNQLIKVYRGLHFFCNPSQTISVRTKELSIGITELGYSVVIPRKQTCSPCLAYHDFAKAVKSIHDVFLVCFCVSHRKLLLSPTKSIVTGRYCLKAKTGGAVNSGCSPFILLWTNLTNMCCIFLLS